MNCVYLMMDEKRNGCAFKVGITSNIEKRYTQYITHNADAQCISRIATQLRSKHSVETMCKAEVIKRGYEFVVNPANNTKTEWFMVSYDDPWYSELCERGLLAFTCAKRRREMGGYGKGDKVLAEEPKKIKPIEMLLPYQLTEDMRGYGPCGWEQEEWYEEAYESYMRECMAAYMVPLTIEAWADKYMW